MNDVFQAPQADPTNPCEMDPRDAVPPVALRGAGLVVFLSGVFTLTTAIQLGIFVSLTFPFVIFFVAFGLLGFANLVLGAMITKGRYWAALAASVSAVAAAVALLAYNVLSLTWAILSPLSILALMLALAAVPCVLVAIPLSGKVTRARDALYSET